MSPAVWIALLAVFLLLLAGRRRARNLRRRDRRRRKESRVNMNEMIRQLLGKRCVVCLDGGFGGSLTGVLEALEYDMPRDLAQNFVRQGLQETERLARLAEDLAVGFRPTRARTLPLAEAAYRLSLPLRPRLARLIARRHR